MPRPPRKRPKQPNGAGSVFYDKARRQWRVAVMLPDGRRRHLRAATEAEARAKCNELLATVAAGEPVKRGTAPSVATQLEWWSEYVLPARKLAPATVEQYRWALGLLTEGLGRARLRSLTPEHVERFLGKLAKDGYSANSVRLVRTTLSQVLTEALKRGHVERNAAALAHLPATAAPPAERDALSADEAHRLLAAAAGDRLAAYWTLALTTGARRGELLGLAWDDVDLDAGTVTIRQALRRGAKGGYELGPTKTTASVRTVRLGPSARTALKGHRAAQRTERMAAGPRWRESGLVFTTTVGTHLDPNTIRHRWDALCKAVGIEGRVPHELRHTAGSLAVDAGVALTEVADQLGHADVNMLARTYRHRTRPVVEPVAAVMEAFITPPRRGRRAR
jgi:integrase